MLVFLILTALSDNRIGLRELLLMRNNYDKRSSLKELANSVALPLASIKVLGLSLGQSHDDFE